MCLVLLLIEPFAFPTLAPRSARTRRAHWPDRERVDRESATDATRLDVANALKDFLANVAGLFPLRELAIGGLLHLQAGVPERCMNRVNPHDACGAHAWREQSTAALAGRSPRARAAPH